MVRGSKRRARDQHFNACVQQRLVAQIEQHMVESMAELGDEVFNEPCGKIRTLTRSPYSAQNTRTVAIGADALKATCKRFVPLFRRTWSFQRDIHNVPGRLDRSKMRRN